MWTIQNRCIFWTRLWPSTRDIIARGCRFMSCFIWLMIILIWSSFLLRCKCVKIELLKLKKLIFGPKNGFMIDFWTQNWIKNQILSPKSSLKSIFGLKNWLVLNFMNLLKIFSSSNELFGNFVVKTMYNFSTPSFWNAWMSHFVCAIFKNTFGPLYNCWTLIFYQFPLIMRPCCWRSRILRHFYCRIWRWFELHNHLSH